MLFNSIEFIFFFFIATNAQFLAGISKYRIKTDVSISSKILIGTVNFKYEKFSGFFLLNRKGALEFQGILAATIKL